MDYLSLVVVLAVVAVVVFAVLGFQKLTSDITSIMTPFQDAFKSAQDALGATGEAIGATGKTIIETVEKIPYGIEQVVTGKEVGVTLPPPTGTPPLIQTVITPISPRGQIPVAREPYATSKGIIPPKPLIVGRLPSPSMGDIGNVLSSLGSFLGGLNPFVTAQAEEQKVGLMDMPPDEVLFQIVGDDLTDVEVRQRMSAMPSFKGKQFWI